MIQTGGFAVPGPLDIRETVERSITWGPPQFDLTVGQVVDGASRDSGSTPTTLLRAGLVLGVITSSGKLTQYSATATDGSQKAVYVLPRSIRVTDQDGNNVDKYLPVLAGGTLKAAMLPNLDAISRSQLSARFAFDDDLAGKDRYLGTPVLHVAKTADYTVVAADSGKCFHTTGAAGAVIFTLPAHAPGLTFEFLNTVDQNMTVSAADADTIIWDGDAAVDSLAFSTASHKIGGRLQFTSIGGKWFVRNLSPSGCTVTAAS